MLRSSLFSVWLLAGAALLCAGCELPHGPLRWEQVHLDRLNILPHGKLNMPGPFCVTDDCEENASRDCTAGPPAYAGHPADAGTAQEPRGPRLMQHHHAVPLAGAGIDAPWPKFHPVPTRPVYEPHCLNPAEATLPQQIVPPQPLLLPQE
jgi:hypothetical protein